jgi:hypothetical protein
LGVETITVTEDHVFNLYPKTFKMDKPVVKAIFICCLLSYFLDYMYSNGTGMQKSNRLIVIVLAYMFNIIAYYSSGISALSAL